MKSALRLVVFLVVLSAVANAGAPGPGWPPTPPIIAMQAR